VAIVTISPSFSSTTPSVLRHPALKKAVAHWGGDPGWARVRPPLVELTPAQSAALIADLDAWGFSMPGLGPRVAKADPPD
jgi:dihydrodipicolinate synthase/N-acetylneuraminate lyase